VIDHVAQVLRIVSTVACGVVLIAFVMWASDEARVSSQQQVAKVATSAPVPPATSAPAQRDGVRGAIEDANAALVGPFDAVAESKGVWLRQGIPALLALLTYGLLARLLINHLPVRR
jgi:hypothetical protein